MAVAVFGTVGTGSATSTDPLDHNHTIASGQSDVLLVAGSGYRFQTETFTVAIWDPAGDNQSLAEAIEGTLQPSGSALSYKAGPANQDDTAYTLRHDYTGAPAEVMGAGVNFSGVDQTTPVSNAVAETAVSGDPNVTVTTNADGDDMVIDSMAKHVGSGGTLTANASQAERWNIDAPSARPNSGGSTEGGGTNPTEMDWTFTGGDNDFAACGMLINAAAAAGGSHPFLRRDHPRTFTQLRM